MKFSVGGGWRLNRGWEKGKLQMVDLEEVCRLSGSCGVVVVVVHRF